VPINKPDKVKIIVITIEGTILSGDREITNASVFLNMLRTHSDCKIVYLDSADRKKMKSVKKVISRYKFPTGNIILKKRHNCIAYHYGSNLELLQENYEVKLLITSDLRLQVYSNILGIPIVITKEDTEWDHEIRLKIMSLANR